MLRCPSAGFYSPRQSPRLSFLIRRNSTIYRINVRILAT